MKTAFITGAGGYIGSCCACTLAKQGIAIAVCDISEAAVQRTVEAITSAGGTARGYVSDVTDCEVITACIDRVAEEMGGIDIMIHVARMRDKSRRVVAIEEVDRIENGEIVLNPLFTSEETGEQKNSEKVEGRLQKTGTLKHKEKLRLAGYRL